MFEQSVIPRGPKGKRFWTVSAGVAGQVVMVGVMAISPMLWPQVIPRASFVMVVPHVPPGKPKGNPGTKARVPRARARSWVGVPPNALTLPTAVPPKIQLIDDVALGATGSASDDACLGCVVGGVEGGSRDGILGPLLRAAGDVPKPPTAAPRAPAAAPARPVQVQRIPGGVVDASQLIYKVDPVYPRLAIVARVQGTVRLHGVIAIDGHISELSVESGNALLVPAAMDAVRQWRYKPTRLNGVPVEVDAIIMVTFTLNR